MSKRGGGPNIIWRKQGGEHRAYIDLRRWGGPRQVALIPAGATRATTDPRLATELATGRIAALTMEKKERERLGLNPHLTLADYADEYLRGKEESGTYSPAWLVNVAAMLDRAVRFFEEVQPPLLAAAKPTRRVQVPRNLAEITAPDVRAFARWVATQPNGRGGTYGPQSVRHHLFAVSGLYRRGKSDGHLKENPVADLADKPAIPESDTRLLEAEEVALALEGARLVQNEAIAANDPSQVARRMVHVAVVLLAYSGTRMDECERLDWADLLSSGDGEYVLRVHSASKGANAGKRRRVRLVPLSSCAVPVLLEWRRRSGRLAGPILADPETGLVPSFWKAFRAVERRTGLPSGTLGSRSMRVAYATHRASCTGVTWNDIKDELGHADLRMQGVVYGRGRLNREPMGDELDYRWDRWAPRLGDTGQRLAGSTSTPGAWELARPAREQIVQTFLAAIEGMGMKRAMKVTGVDRSAIQRLRKFGETQDVKSATLDRMRDYLARLDEKQRTG
jgi:integrase